MAEAGMLERVARAVMAEMARQAGAEVVGNRCTITTTGTVEFSTKKIARAAIESMREPGDATLEVAAQTPGMKALDAIVMTAYARSGVDMLKPHCAEGSPLQQAWRAMIDVILAEDGRDG